MSRAIKVSKKNLLQTKKKNANLLAGLIITTSPGRDSAPCTLSETCPKKMKAISVPAFFCALKTVVMCKFSFADYSLLDLISAISVV